MTTQQAYEKMRAWFSKPGRPFGYDDRLGACQYRGGGDPHSSIRCAVGCLIPPRKYDPEIELQTVWAQPDYFELVLPGVDLGFLDEAQRAHDRLATDKSLPTEARRARFIEALDLLAKRYKLDVVSDT